MHPLEVSSGGEACKKDQQRQQALGLLAVMRQTCFLPGVISYSAVISACEKDQQWQRALGLLELMQQTRVLPGVISYSAVFSACETGPTNVAGLGSLGIDTADCHSAERHFSLSRHQCL